MTACEDQQSPDQINSKNFFQRDTIEIFHQILPLTIPVQGELIAWQESNIVLPVPTKMIALLVEPNILVNKNDLVASLWDMSVEDEYTPVDIKAPFNGIVTEVNYQIGDQIEKNKSIMRIKNYDNYSFRTYLKTEQIQLVDTKTTIFLSNGEYDFSGRVENVDRKTGNIEVVLRNKISKLTDLTVTGKLICQPFGGSFIRDKFFGQLETVNVVLEEGINLTLKKIALSDSLALISPDIPDQSFVFLKGVHP